MVINKRFLLRANVLLKPGKSSSFRRFKLLLLFASAGQNFARFVSTENMAKEFPPEKVRAIVTEVAALLKEKKETVSVAETVSSTLSVQHVLQDPT